MTELQLNNDQFKKTTQRLKSNPLLPVIVLDTVDDAIPLAEALLAGGLSVIEITMRTPVAADAIRQLNDHYPELLIGAGTVVSKEQAQQAIEAGASFGLAPGLNPDIVRYFQSKGVLFMPGIMTPSELEEGLSLGCKLFKFFPAEQAGGVRFLQSISAPYESYGVNFCPTGGVTLSNMADYLALPSVSNIGGTWLATRQQIAEKDWTAITQQVKQAILKIDPM